MSQKVGGTSILIPSTPAIHGNLESVGLERRQSSERKIFMNNVISSSVGQAFHESYVGSSLFAYMECLASSVTAHRFSSAALTWAMAVSAEENRESRKKSSVECLKDPGSALLLNSE